MSKAHPSTRDRIPLPPKPSLPGRPPERHHAVAGGVEVLVRIVVALAVAAALSSERLVESAEQRPYGTMRSILVPTAEVVEHGAAKVGITGARAVVVAVIDAGGDAALDGASAEPDSIPRATIAGPSTVSALPEGLPRPRQQPISPITAGPPAAAGPLRPANPPRTVPTTAGPPQPTTPTTAGPPQPTTPTTAGPPRPTTPPPQPTTPTTAGRAQPTAGPPGAASQTGAARTDTEESVHMRSTPVRTVDGASKLRIWAGGDSLGEYVGNQLLSPVGNPDLTEVELSYHISTGLARPDYFDWQAEFESVMTRSEPPEALVYMVGGNDDQGMRNESGNLGLGSEEWEAEYGRRAAHLMDLAETGTSHLYWIGLPPMREGRREEVSVRMNVVVEREADARPWVTFLEMSTLFASPDGGYAAQLPDPTGRLRVVRAPDGVHVNYNGSEWIAERVWAAIVDRWRLDGATAVAPRGAR